MCSRDMHGALRSIVNLDVQGRVAVFYVINRVANVDKNGDFGRHVVNAVVGLGTEARGRYD
jgi:hypothetical protein